MKYKVYNYRCQEGIQDVKYFTIKRDALVYFEAMPKRPGYQPVIEKVLPSVYGEDYEVIKYGEIYKGECIADKIVVAYRHHRYINYAYDIIDVDYAGRIGLNHEADIVNETDSTASIYYELFDSVEELKDAWEKKWGVCNKIHSGAGIIKRFVYENI